MFFAAFGIVRNPKTGIKVNELSTLERNTAINIYLIRTIFPFRMPYLKTGYPNVSREDVL